MADINFYSKLQSELTRYEMSPVESYILKAQKFYDNGQDDEARYALEDAISIFKKKGNLHAANRVQHYANRLVTAE